MVGLALLAFVDNYIERKLLVWVAGFVLFIGLFSTGARGPWVGALAVAVSAILTAEKIGKRTFQAILAVLFVVSLISIYWSLRKEKGKRLFPIIFVLIALCFGLAISGWQATSAFVLTLFALQRGTVPLKPWTTAIGLFLLAYHVGLNLGLSNAYNENILYFVIGTVALLAVSQRPLEPDHPRLSSITIGITSIIIGTVLTAQYDRGVQRSMENELKQTQEVREQFAKL